MSNLIRFLFFFFGLITISAQIDDSKKPKSIEERILENNALMMSKPEVAFHELENLLKEAKEIKNQEAEI